jgi:hypothetical protein
MNLINGREPRGTTEVKDRLEDKLHKLVCSGQLDLKTAQKAIASNWIEAYKKYVSPNPPSSRLAPPSATEPPLNSDQVWVNTKSGKYWKLGSRYYGKTKQGEYMSEKEAVQKGYRPANRTGEMTVAVNHKLTHVVKDRVVQNFQLNASELLISFVDGSTMKVKIVESNSPPLREGARIRQISEDQAKLLFECEDDCTLDVTVVDPGSSVAVRDKTHQVEYLG